MRWLVAFVRQLLQDLEAGPNPVAVCLLWILLFLAGEGAGTFFGVEGTPKTIQLW